MKLQEKIKSRGFGQAMAEKEGEYRVPTYGNSGLVPRYNPEVWQPPTPEAVSWTATVTPKPASPEPPTPKP